MQNFSVNDLLSNIFYCFLLCTVFTGNGSKFNGVTKLHECTKLREDKFARGHKIARGNKIAKGYKIARI